MINAIPFTKMHGLGNDFVIIDARKAAFAPAPAETRAIADRRMGIGCDQLIVMEQPTESLADVFMRIRNADGSEVAACGNAARCVARLIMDENNSRHAIIQTDAGLLDAEAGGDGVIAVDMGPVRLDWRDIPLGKAIDTLHLDITVGELSDPVGVNVGNPHAVFMVDDAPGVPLEILGPEIEHHALFPEFTNVEVVEILSPEQIRVRVWERGVGITRACGTGACAALIATHRRGLTGRTAEVILDGGPLQIEWMKDNHVLMTGPVATSFQGTFRMSGLTDGTPPIGGTP